jgi:Trp operon repressor
MTTKAKPPELPAELLRVLARLDRVEDVARLLSDLLTPAEIEALGERWQIVQRLAGGQSQREVAAELGVSITTVSRGSRQLKYGVGGIAMAQRLLGKKG